MRNWGTHRLLKEPVSTLGLGTESTQKVFDQRTEDGLPVVLELNQELGRVPSVH